MSIWELLGDIVVLVTASPIARRRYMGGQGGIGTEYLNGFKYG